MINDIIDEFETESACARTVNYQESFKINVYENTQIPKYTFLNKLEFPIKICNSKLNEK